MRRGRFLRSLPLVLAVTVAAAAARGAADDWPGLRGPNFDGSASAGSRLGTDAAGELAIAWRATLGPGYSSVAIADGRAITLFSEGEKELAVAFDAATGRELWRTPLGPTYKGHDGSFDGPIATPTIAGSGVYAFGPRGLLSALDASSGRVLWQVDLPKAHGSRPPFYGFASSPLVVAGKLVVEIGAEKGSAIAGFDARTGVLEWKLGDDAVNYQSPIVVRVGGRDQLVAVGDTKLFGIDAKVGKVLWEHPHGAEAHPMGSESLVPLPAGEGRLFVKSGLDASTMFRVVEGAAGHTTLQKLWTAPVMRSTYSLPVYHDGFLYGFNGKLLTCVDAATGQLRWRSREPGDGFLLQVGPDLVVLTKERMLHVAAASPDGFVERGRIEGFHDLVWTPPSFGAGAIFARSQGEIARFEWRGGAASTSTPVAAPAGDRGAFRRFLDALPAAPDKAGAVDTFLAATSRFPLVEWPDRVTFLYRGAASDMGIAGEMIGSRREDPMERVPDTDLFFYEARVEPDARLNYYFVRNFDERIKDPRNPVEVPGTPRVGRAEPVVAEASSLAMPVWKEPWYVHAGPDHGKGRIEPHEVRSASLPGVKLTVSVYVPAAYDDDPGRRFPAVFVFGGDDARTKGFLDRSLDTLFGHSVEPAVVAFLGAIDWAKTEPDDEEQAADALAAFVAREVVPFVDGRYRTRAEPGARAAAGAGFDAWDAGYTVFKEPGVFGALGVQSFVMLDAEEVLLHKHVRSAGEQPLRLYLDWGLYDIRATREAWDNRRMNERFLAFLRERGYRPAGGETREGFGWASWRNYTDRVFEALLPAGPLASASHADGAGTPR